MGQSYQSGQVEATIINNITNGATIQTLPAKTDTTVRTPVQKCMAQTTAANTHYTIHTVTGGKTLYLTQITASSSSGGVIRIGDNTSGNTFTSTTIYDNCIAVNTNVNTAVVNFSTPFKISTSVKFSSDQVTGVNVSIIGWEEDT